MMEAGAMYGGGELVEEGPEPKGPLCVLAIVVASIALPWYFSASDDASLHIKLILMLLPMLLLLALTFMPSTEYHDSEQHHPFFSSSSSPSSHHYHYQYNSYSAPYSSDYYTQTGLMDSHSASSPWALAFFLFLILSMLWYHSGVLSSWHPIIRS